MFSNLIESIEICLFVHTTSNCCDVFA